MKSLVKLRLINWHYFTNTTADIKNITFLTGPNGTGKSTVIDALQILILGSTRPENFNKAANEKARSGRTLISYLRGQTGVTGDGQVINLRKGSFTSYIAIEIFDDVENRTFTLGVVFDVDSSDQIDKHYFYYDGPFLDNGFTNSEVETDPKKIKPLQYRELSSYIRSNFKPSQYRFFDTDTDYKTFIKEAYGNLPDKYFELFKKAVSFAPISDISSFITEYICDVDKQINIEAMQKNIEQYKLLELEAKKLKNKVESLTKISEIFTTYKKHQRYLNTLTYVNTRVSYEKAKKIYDNLLERVSKANNRLMAISNELIRCDEQIAELNADLESYNAKKVQSKNYSLTERISMKKDNVLAKMTSIKTSVSTVITKLNDYLHDYQTTCQNFVNYYSQFNTSRLGKNIKEPFDRLIELCQDIVTETGALMSSIDEDQVDFKLVEVFRTEMENLRSDAVSVRQLLNSELYTTSEQMQQLQSDLNAVNSGRKPFEKLGPAYIAIKSGLETELKARHSDAYVNIFCDLVNVNDPEWVLALEAVLYGQKFNFFVNPKYYEEANRLLKELADEYHYYRVSLVDTDRLLANHIRANEGSIAELIDTDDEGARAYTDYLLGRIKKCKTFQEARASGSGLLSDCTGYRGYATWYLNKDNARVFFLGTQVSSSTKALSASDYQEMRGKYELYTEALNKLQNLLSLPIMSAAECQSYQSSVDKTHEVSSLQQELSSLDSELHDASMGDMNDLEKKISAIKEDIAAIEKERGDLLTERGSLTNDLQRLNGEEIPTANRNVETFKASLSTFDPDLTNKEYEPYFAILTDQQHMTFAQIEQQATREYIQTQNKQKYERENLIRLRSDYCATNHLGYNVTDVDNNDEFDKELQTISTVMLPEYEEKIVKAHDDSIKEFKDDFIYKLRTSINTVYQQIDELNQALADSHFGRDRYQFKVSPSKDYREYYDMIMDPALLSTGDAESIFMEKYKTTMDDLFQLISSSTSSSGEQKEQIVKNIDTYTRYTTYIVFDLLVIRGDSENAQPISLGRSFRSQSGGETQTPFYIAILASFAALCRANNPKDNNTLRLVIFDEAFSKMDSARIKESTSLLREFGLQAILSTPSEKLRDLISYVDLILISIHDDKRKRSTLDIYEEKKKAIDKPA